MGEIPETDSEAPVVSCQRCGRKFTLELLSHSCGAMSDAHVALPSQPDWAKERATWARSIAEAERAHGEKLAEALDGILAFCNADGSPVDGFRFREEVARARAALTAWRNR